MDTSGYIMMMVMQHLTDLSQFNMLSSAFSHKHVQLLDIKLTLSLYD